MSVEKLADFACLLYANPRVELQCRHLQDFHYANINIVLWLCWLDREGIYLKKNALDAAQDLIGEVAGDVVSLLRHVRSRVKSIGRFTRVQEQFIVKNILQAELAVEKILLERLQDLTGRLERIANIDAEPLSLFDYLEHLRVPSPGSIAGDMLALGRVLEREKLKG